jgi:hypothetical protein
MGVPACRNAYRALAAPTDRAVLGIGGNALPNASLGRPTYTGPRHMHSGLKTRLPCASK